MDSRDRFRVFVTLGVRVIGSALSSCPMCFISGTPSAAPDVLTYYYDYYV
jgi:hypothetical protein